MKRGDYVRTWFDTGAMGVTILYGEVIAAGPKTYRVRWESGLTNRVRQDRKTVELCASVSVDDVTEARFAMSEHNHGQLCDPSGKQLDTSGCLRCTLGRELGRAT